MSEFHDLDRRVAVFEQIARNTETALTEIRTELRSLRTEMVAEFRALRTEMTAEFRAIRSEAKSDYRSIIGIMLGGFGLTLTGFAGLLAVMAHGFHWI